jgi:hypothetical protein
MPTEVQIYKDATIIPADLSTGGPSWDASGYLTATGFKVGTQSGFLKADGTVDNLTGAGGNFTINNTAPTVFLRDTDHRSSMLHCNSNYFYVLRGDAVNSLTFATYNGYWPLQINLENNDTTLGGNLSCVGDITAFVSDIRLKTNIEPIQNALDKVLSLNGFTYNFNEIGEGFGFDTSLRHAGVSAQEVQAVLPEVVATAPISDKYITVKYEKLVPLLIESIKELNSKIEILVNSDN